MAQKRMFNKSVVESDAFLQMPLSAQALYFHIGMMADDDGFCSQTRSILCMTGARDDDLKVLVAKSFLIPFDDGVMVVKHWRVNNYLQNDRVKQTEYLEDKGKLFIKPNKIYTLDPEKGTPLIPMDKKCIQNVSIDKTRVEQSRLEENRLGEDIKDIDDVRNDSKGEDLQKMINERVKRMREERYGK